MSFGNVLVTEFLDKDGRIALRHTGVYDDLGRLEQTIDGEGNVESYVYDGFSRPVVVTDRLGRSMVSSYDELNRVQTVLDPRDGLVVGTYDPRHNPLMITDQEGLSTTYAYNGLGDRESVSSPDTGSASFRYDLAGNRVESTDARGVKTVFTYDAIDRLALMSDIDGDVSREYDQGPNGIGRLTRLSDGTGTTEWRYNAWGQSVEKTQSSQGLTLSLGYDHDDLGNTVGLVYPSGLRVDYVWESGAVRELLINGSVLMTKLDYEPFGPVRSWESGVTGRVHVREFDKRGLLVSVTVGDTSRTFDYDGRGNLRSRSGPGYSARFEYDDSNQLTGFEGTVRSRLSFQSYSYDGVGNRMTKTDEAGLSVYDYDIGSHRLRSIVGPDAREYSYDDAGGVLSDGVHTYGYDARHRVTVVDGVERYSYNGRGERIGRFATDLGLVTYFYDAGGRMLGEYRQDGSAIQETVFLGDIPVATIRDGLVYEVHTDHTGTPQFVTNGSGEIVWRWDSVPFGESAVDEDPDGDGVQFRYDYRFPGQVHDSETELYYNYYRYYDPSTGRYMKSDPIGIGGGLSTYAYAGNSPTNLIDPKGLQIWICYRAAWGGNIPGTNHAYLWDDRAGSRFHPSCGMSGSSGGGSNGEFELGPGVDHCVPVQGSSGREDDVMKCCRDTANDGIWAPWANDCFNAAQDCVEGSGLQAPPGSPGRIGPRCDPSQCPRDPNSPTYPTPRLPYP